MKKQNALESESLVKIETVTKQKISTKTKVALTMLIAVSAFAASIALAGFAVSVSKLVTNSKESIKLASNTEIDALRNQFFNKDGSLKEKLSVPMIQNAILEKGSLWRAGENKFSQYSEDQKTKLLGVKPTDEQFKKSSKISKNLKNRYTNTTKNGRTIPDFFDYRNLNGGINYITPVKDQGQCGSCWAFAALAMLESKINLHYNNPNLDKDLSEQDLISCFKPNGCQGLYADEFPGLFNYLNVTKSATEQCFSYQACDSTGGGSCSNGGIPCSNKCSNFQDNAWGMNNYQSVPLGDISAMKQALINNGPIVAGMYVYSDFFSYSSGVYQHTTGSFAGGHAVLIVGFGTYDGIDYWIVKNSWGNDWGENINGERPNNCSDGSCGYFRIAVGDDSGIESWFIYTAGNSESQENETNVCTDTDSDGYCYWGLGDKPDNCPVCDDVIKDCDDSNASIFENCGQAMPAGILSINSSQQNSEVYIRDAVSNNWVYRGLTPINIELNAGTRDIKVYKFGYLDFETTTNISAGATQNLSVNLQHDSQFMDGWPVEIVPIFPQPINNFKTFAVSDINNDGLKEIIVVTNTDNINDLNSQYAYSIYVFRSNGQMMPGWPQVLPQNSSLASGCTVNTNR